MDQTLLNARISALYVYDEHKRILRVNETDSKQPIPYFYFLRSTTLNLWRCRYDLPDDLAAELDVLAQSEALVDDLNQPLQHQQQYIDLLEQFAPISKAYSGLAYTLPEIAPSGKAITITAENSAMLEKYFSYAIDSLDELNPIAAAIEDNVAVSICFCARRTVQLAEAGLYTEVAYRKRAYALEVVRQWAQALRATGRLPFYSTSHENLASQAVARKLGAVQYGTDFSFS